MNVITTAHDPSDCVTVKKRAKDGSSKDVRCPLVIVEYTRYMHGVDRFDQLRDYNSVTRKSRKWWVRIFYFLLDCTLVNAYILHRLAHEDNAHHLQFLVTLSSQLANGYSSRKRAIPCAP